LKILKSVLDAQESHLVTFTICSLWFLSASIVCG
jgi:hypothetical protein